MGTTIHLYVADTTTQAEWEPAYEEALRLAEALGLTDLKYPKQILEDRPLYPILIPARETESFWGPCLQVCGDPKAWILTETNTLYRRLREPKQGPAVDPMLALVQDYGFDSLSERHWGFWGSHAGPAFTHLGLLAIGCMLEERLPGKVCVGGSISRGMCRAALRLAAPHLEAPVSLPARCSLERLLVRVQAMGLSEADSAFVFHTVWLGNHDATYGAFLETHFSSEARDALWRRVLGETEIGLMWFQWALEDYLLAGGSVRDLGRLLAFRENPDKERAERFVKAVLSPALHLPPEQRPFSLALDNERETPDTLPEMVQDMFSWNRIPIDRYIPPEELQAELEECVGDLCDVPALIRSWEPPALTVANANPPEPDHSGWDIAFPRELFRYRKGNSILPSLDEQERTFFDTLYDTAPGPDLTAELFAMGPDSLWELSMSTNSCLLLTEAEWAWIRDRLRKDIRFFLRLYCILLVRKGTEDAQPYLRPILLNEDLYGRYLDPAKHPELPLPDPDSPPAP